MLNDRNMTMEYDLHTFAHVCISKPVIEVQPVPHRLKGREMTRDDERCVAKSGAGARPKA